MSNTAPSRADPVVVFPIGRWCPPQETSQPHPPPQMDGVKPIYPQQLHCAVGLVTWANLVNTGTMAADALAPCVARSPAARVLTSQDEWELVFHNEEFHVPVASQFWEMIENANFISRPQKSIQQNNG